MILLTQHGKDISKELDEKYGFSMALEWLVESNTPNVYEMKFLNASTCFEMLMDRFHARNQTDLLLAEDAFKEFYQDIKKYMSELLRARKVSASIRSAIYKSLTQANRRTYSEHKCC